MPSFLSDIFVVQRFKICVAHFPEAPVAKLLAPTVRTTDKNACAFPERFRRRDSAFQFCQPHKITAFLILHYV